MYKYNIYITKVIKFNSKLNLHIYNSVYFIFNII